MNPNDYLVLSAILFAIGIVGFLTRRNALVAFMSVELMLNAANLALVTFAHVHGSLDGQVGAFFVMIGDHRHHFPFPSHHFGGRHQPAEVLREVP